MKKTGRIFALFLLIMTMVQCTDDDEVEAGVYESQNYNFYNKERGDQELDNDRD